MASFTEWKSLRNRFEKLDDRQKELRAELNPQEDEEGNISDHWELRGRKTEDEHDPEAFNVLAELGAKYLRLNLSEQEAWEGWLNELLKWLQEVKSKKVKVKISEIPSKVIPLRVILSKPSPTKAHGPYVRLSLPYESLKTTEHPTIDQVCYQSAKFCDKWIAKAQPKTRKREGRVATLREMVKGYAQYYPQLKGKSMNS